MLPIGGRNTGGVTPSERYLAQLCERSFLSLWSHPNLFKKVNQELCDLLVVFGDDVIVFSDKSCAVPHGPHGWPRWYQRAILSSAHQLHRAAGWLRKHPSDVFLNARCTTRFPFALPQSPRVHLVAVAIGAGDACRTHYGGGSGSLAIAPASTGSEPFEVGDLEPARDFVHIFDDVTLDIVLRELDTIDDFLEYLRGKVAFVRSGRLGYAAGEEDLLAYYILNEHTFPIPTEIGDRQIGIKDAWDFITRSPRYIAKKDDDRVSYIWDELIERVADAALTKRLDVSGDTDLRTAEHCLRLMARESRLARRALGQSLTKFLRQANEHDAGYDTARRLDRPDEAYVFLTHSRWPFPTEIKYRESRQRALEARCTTVKGEYPHLKRIVGIGMAPPRDGDLTLDLIVDTHERDWTDAEIERAIELRRLFGWRPAAELPVLREAFVNYPPGSIRRAAPAKSAVTDKRKAKRKAQRAARKRHRS